MIDPASYDWAGNNTSQQQRRSAWRFIRVVALVVGSFAFFTMILWGI